MKTQIFLKSFIQFQQSDSFKQPEQTRESLRTAKKNLEPNTIYYKDTASWHDIRAQYQNLWLNTCKDIRLKLYIMDDTVNTKDSKVGHTEQRQVRKLEV